MGTVSEPIQFHGVAILIEPESVKYVLDQLCKQAGVQVCLHTMLDYNTPNPVNRVGDTKDVDYVAITPRDSKSGLHYVFLAGVERTVEHRVSGA